MPPRLELSLPATSNLPQTEQGALYDRGRKGAVLERQERSIHQFAGFVVFQGVIF